MARSWLALLSAVGVTALACTSAPQEAEETMGGRQAGRTPIPRACPANWPGPWTVCPEADWVHELAERAGYRITGETGTALIARGKGSSFYIWATEATPEAIKELSRREKGPPFRTVEGVQVYGDESLWRWWVVDRFVFWLQAGPDDESQLPSLEGMASLVRASETLPLPRY